MPDIRPVPDDIVDDIVVYRRQGAATVGVDLADEPAAIMEALTAYLRAVKGRGDRLGEEQVIGIGALIGEQYVRAFGWHWAEVNFDGDGRDHHYFVCVLPPDEALSINPVHWVRATLDNPHSTTTMLNFNMVAANNIPGAAPGKALGFY